MYLVQSIRFLKPVFIGDIITTTCEIKEVQADRPVMVIACRCKNQRGEEVMTGEASVLVDSYPFVPRSRAPKQV